MQLLRTESGRPSGTRVCVSSRAPAVGHVVSRILTVLFGRRGGPVRGTVGLLLNCFGTS